VPENVIGGVAGAIIGELQDIFRELDQWVPGVFPWFRENVLQFPLVDYERLFDLADAYQRAGDLYRNHLEDVNSYVPDLQGWQGSLSGRYVHEDLLGYRDRLSETLQAISAVRGEVHEKAVEIEASAFMGVVNLILAIVAIVQLLVTIWTGIGTLISTAQLFGYKMAIKKIMEELLEKLWEQGIKAFFKQGLRKGLTKAAWEGAKGFGKFTLWTRGGITVLQTLEGHDPLGDEGALPRLGMEIVDSWVTGAIAGPLGLGIPSKLWTAATFGAGQTVDNMFKYGRDRVIDWAGLTEEAKNAGLYSGMKWEWNTAGNSLLSGFSPTALVGAVMLTPGGGRHGDFLHDLATEEVRLGTQDLFSPASRSGSGADGLGGRLGSTEGRRSTIRSPERDYRTSAGLPERVHDLDHEPGHEDLPPEPVRDVPTHETGRDGPPPEPGRDVPTEPAHDRPVRDTPARDTERPSTGEPTRAREPAAAADRTSTSEHATAAAAQGPHPLHHAAEPARSSTVDSAGHGVHRPAAETSADHARAETAARSPGDRTKFWNSWKEHVREQYQQHYTNALVEHLGQAREGTGPVASRRAPELTPAMVERVLEAPAESLNPYGARLRSFVEQHFTRVEGGARRTLDAAGIEAKVRELRGPATAGSRRGAGRAPTVAARHAVTEERTQRDPRALVDEREPGVIPGQRDEAAPVGHEGNGAQRVLAGSGVAGPHPDRGGGPTGRTPVDQGPTNRPPGYGDEHSASSIAGTRFVADGRDAGSVFDVEVLASVQETRVSDYAGRVTELEEVGHQLRVRDATGHDHYFEVRVRDQMRDVARTTIGAGTRDDPHVVTVSAHARGDVLPRTWIHEIVETLGTISAERGDGERGQFGHYLDRYDGPVSPGHIEARLAERQYLMNRLSDPRLEWDHPALRVDLNGLDHELTEAGFATRDLPQPPDPPGGVRDDVWLTQQWTQEHRFISVDEVIPSSYVEGDRWYPKIVEALRPIFEGRDFGGLRVRLDERLPIQPHRDELTVGLQVLDRDGTVAGHMTFTLRRGADGHLTVYHDSVGIHRSVQGRGFYRALNSHLREWYRSSGVDWVERRAVDVGAYFQAREGTDWHPNGEHSARAIFQRLHTEIDRLDRDAADVRRWLADPYSPHVDIERIRQEYRVPDHALLDEIGRQRTAAADIYDRARNNPFGGRDYPTPHEVAEAGRPESGPTGSDRMWAGKRALLGAEWRGVERIGHTGPLHPRGEPPATHRAEGPMGHRGDQPGGGHADQPAGHPGDQPSGHHGDQPDGPQWVSADAASREALRVADLARGHDLVGELLDRQFGHGWDPHAPGVAERIEQMTRNALSVGATSLKKAPEAGRVQRFLREQFGQISARTGRPEPLPREVIADHLRQQFGATDRAPRPPVGRDGDPRPAGDQRQIERLDRERVVETGDGLYRVDRTMQRRFSQEFEPFPVERYGIDSPQAREATHRAAQAFAEAMHQHELTAIDRWLTTNPDDPTVAAVRAELSRTPNTATAIMLRDGTIHAFTSVRDFTLSGPSVRLGPGVAVESLLSGRTDPPLNHWTVDAAYAGNRADRAGHEGVCAEPGAVSDIARRIEPTFERDVLRREGVTSRDQLSQAQERRYRDAFDQRLRDELRDANIASHRVGGREPGQEQFPCPSDDVLVHHFAMHSDYASRFADLAEVQPERGIISLVPQGDPLRTHAAAIPSVDPRTLVVVVHGEHTGDGFALAVGGERLSHVEIHRVIEELVSRHPQLAGRDRIVLVSCESGRDISVRGAEENFAQKLAIRSGKAVYAPIDVAWISNRGGVAVGPQPPGVHAGDRPPGWVGYDPHGHRFEQPGDPFAGHGGHGDGGEGTTWLKADEESVRAATDAAMAARSPHPVVSDAAIEHFVASMDHIDATTPAGGTSALQELAKRAVHDPAAELKSLGGGEGKGQSGAPVYFVKDASGHTVAIAKMFPKIEELLRELSTVERLGHDEFTHFKVPEPLDVAVADLPGGERAGLYVMSLAPGRSIFEMFDGLPAHGTPEREAALAEVARAMRDAGTAIGELHSKPAGSGGPVSREFLEYHYGVARTELAEIATRANRRVLDRLGLDAATTVRHATELIDESLRVDGGAALLHGDAHPGNLFWDREGGVTFIDFPAGHFAIAPDGHPIGAPERDIANMMERTALFGREHDFTESEITALQHAFREAYHEFRDDYLAGRPELSVAQERGFTARYAVRDMLESLRALARSGHDVDPELIHRLTIQTELVKAAMGEVPHFEPGLDFTVTGHPDPMAMPPEPNRVFHETHADAVAALEWLDGKAEQLLAAGDGVGWFAKVYYYVTRFELEMIDGGHYTYPIMKLQEVVAFYDTYRVNLERWLESPTHPSLEPNWREAFQAARSAGDRWHALPSLEVMRELLPSIEAHIRFDLPRAIAAVFEAHYAQSGLALSAFKQDFDRMQIVFDRASEAVQKDIGAATERSSPVRSRLDPGRSRLLQKYGFPFVFNTLTQRQFAWERAEDLVALHAQGLHDQAAIQRDLEDGHEVRHPFHPRDSFSVAGKHIDDYNWDGQPRPITAARVPESQFHGHGRSEPDPVAVQNAGRQALQHLVDRLPPGSVGRGLHLEVTSVPAHELPDAAVARSVPLQGGGYRIELSDRAADITIERAVAHELAELSAIEARSDLDLSGANALRPGEFDPSSRLSPHDLGRLAELDVLGRLLADPRHAEYARGEIAALREHLGLRPAEPGAEQRWALVEGDLSPEARGALDAAAPPHGATTSVHPRLRPTDVDRALDLAEQSRTPQGLVDRAVLAQLADALPTIDISAGTGAGLTAFVAAAVGEGITLEAMGGEGAKGHSGAPVSLVHDAAGQVVAISKIFPNFDEFVRELSSLGRLHSPEFSRFRAPDVIAIGKMETPEGPAGVLVSTRAAGTGIDDLIKAAGRADAGSRPEKLATLSTALTQTAAALAELHTRPEGSGGHVAPEYVKFHTDLARSLTADVALDPEVYQTLGGLPIDELRQRVDEAVALSLTHAGWASIAHGDAHPGNFFWDPSAVTFIDTPTLHFSIDQDGRPIGEPERDISNLLERTSHYGHEFGLSPAEIAQLRDTVLGTYRDAGGAPLDPVLMRMFAARSVLNKLLQVGGDVRAFLTENPGVAVPADLLEKLQAEIGLLRDALGWRP
jgi:Ser/Thr protein kinase RdoA (MazF antagonist)